MTDNANFDKVYASLNPAQKTAVDTIEGPVMVIAGPGTGKTQVLSARIANILRITDINPSNILALTFTESAAANMRSRLVSMIGQTGYYVRISTFHSFCMEVIKSNPDYFSIERNSDSLSQLERYQLFQDIINRLDLEVLKPMNTPLYFIRDMVGAISQLKREGVSPEDFALMVTTSETVSVVDRNVKKNIELSRIYTEYQKDLSKMGRYDFDDMIRFVIDAFGKHKDLLSEYQEKITYFLVDEYQDTNNSQNQLVKVMTDFWGDEANLFVVGDPHQSIFRFQGASIENSLSFVTDYPRATIVRLDTGYRAGQEIYDAAAAIISNNQLTHENSTKNDMHHQLFDFFNSPIISAKSESSQIILATLPSQLAEYVYIAESISKLIKSGVNPSDIAILYRNNYDAKLIRETLDKWGIIHELDTGDDVLKHESLRQFMQLCTLIAQVRDGGETADLFEVLCYQWMDMDTNIVAKVARVAGQSKLSLIEVIRLGFDNYSKIQKENVLTPIEFHQLTDILNKITDWGLQDYKTTFPTWFEEVLSESGYLEWMLKQVNKVELITNISTLYKEVKNLSNANHNFKLRDFLRVIETILYFRLELKAEDFTVVDNAVKLSTVHKAKGQEWAYVFLIHCIDGKWGNNRPHDLIKLPDSLLKNTDLSKKERNEDERRLFYVATTRAKKQLVISYPQVMISASQSKTVVPSMFISEIPESLVTVDDKIITPPEGIKFLEDLLTPQKTFFFSQIDESFFRNLVDKMILSVTALNTYLHDKEEFVRNVLIKVPRAKASPMAFGTAVHKALEEFYKHLLSTGERLSVDEVLTLFKTSLSRELLTGQDYERRLEYGKKVLAGYYENQLMNPIKPYGIERFFGGMYRPVMLDDIPLSGRIDRIDFVDESAGSVRVIDYKTGTAKTVGEIEATVKSSPLSEREMTLPDSIRGGYKRQLLFYKLLTDLDPTFDKNVIEGEFDFIEPDKQSGKYIKRTFPLLKSEVSELKELIRLAMKEIRSLEFLK